MRPILSFFGLALAMAANVPSPAFAQIPSREEYAEQQCGNGRAAAKGYRSYEQCYDFALDYYFYAAGGGDGGGGGGGSTGGGGGGTFIGDIPGYTGNDGNPPCNSRLCLPGEPTEP
jgi:hypothetical protein